MIVDEESTAKRRTRSSEMKTEGDKRRGRGRRRGGGEQGENELAARISSLSLCPHSSDTFTQKE
jgi:hypothetical protein